MNKEIIRYKDLSGWLKFAFIYTLISAGFTAFWLMLIMLMILLI